MTVSISFPPETERKLLRCAAARGKPVDDFVREVIEEKLRDSRTWEQTSEPIARAVPSNMTDQQVEDFFREVRDEVRAEKVVL